MAPHHNGAATMSHQYEQEVIITLTQAEACSLRVQLGEYLRHITRELQSSPTYTPGEEMNPNSCMGNAHKLLHNLVRVSLGDKSDNVTKQVTYKMVKVD
jgi:hypothetical protein